MSYLLRNGVAVYFEVHGTGPTVLLTHGYAATGTMWTDQIEAITKTNRLILWDMRGHGRTDSPADADAYSEAETVADMAAILDVVGDKQAIVGGHSLGGYMSLAFHLAHPDRVRALLLCGTGPGYWKDESRAAWNDIVRGLAATLEREGLESLNKLYVEMEATQHKSAYGLATSARGMLAQRDSRVVASLPSIAVPTFITVGENDVEYLTGTAYLASKIASAEYHKIPNAGHAANIDQQALFNAALARFLAARVGQA